jgi:flagellar biosynthetic protein FliR
MVDSSLYALPQLIVERLDYCWTFFLLLTRFVAFLMIVPGLGGGMMGVTVRYPAAIMLSLLSFDIRSVAPVPADIAVMAAHISSEVLLGALVGLVPILIVAGAQTAGHIASGTMGLNGAQLVDPTTATTLPDLARIYSDFSIIVFLLVGGHYVAITQLASLSQVVTPGTFMLSDSGIQVLINQTGRIFQMGVMMSAPVIVALLLANFVMGIVSKAVPTVNVFTVSFPITIGIGLILSIASLPEVMYYLARQFTGLEGTLSQLTAVR